MLHSSLDKLESCVRHTHIHTKGGNNGCQSVASRGSYLDTCNPLLSQRDSKSQCPLLLAPPNLSAEESATHLQQPRSLPLCLRFMCSPTEELAAQAHSRAEFLTSLMKLWRAAVCQIILVQSCLYCSLLLRYCFPLLGTHIPLPAGKHKKTTVLTLYIVCCNFSKNNSNW